MYIGHKVLNLLIFYTVNVPRRISCCTTHFPSDERMNNESSNFVNKKRGCKYTSILSKWFYRDRIY